MRELSPPCLQSGGGGEGVGARTPPAPPISPPLLMSVNFAEWPFYWYIMQSIFLMKLCPSCLVEDRNSLGVASHTRRICDQVLPLAAAFECKLASSLHG